MSLHKYIPTILSFFIVFTATSQKKTVRKIEALNVVIEYLNFVNTSLLTAAQQVTQSHDKTCVLPTDSNRYKEILAAEQIPEIAKKVEEISANYLKIGSDLTKKQLISENEFDRQIRIENAFTKNKQLFDEVFIEIESQYAALFEESDVARKAELQLRDCIKIQLRLFDFWHINANEINASESFPLDLIVENINGTDFKYLEYNLISSDNKSLDIVLHNIFHTIIHSFQNLKRKKVDFYIFKQSTSDEYSNRAYFDIARKLTEAILPGYNNLQSKSRILKNGVLKIPFPAPVLIFSRSNESRQKVTARYSPVSLSKLFPKKVEREILPFEFQSLSAFIIYLNRQTLYMYLLTRNMYQKNELFINKYHENVRTNVFQKPIATQIDSFPRSVFEKAMNDCRFVPLEFRKNLNRQTKALFILLQEAESIALMIENELEAKSDSMQLTNMFKRYEYLSFEYDNKRKLLVGDVEMIFSSFEKASNENFLDFRFLETHFADNEMEIDQLKTFIFESKNDTSRLTFSTRKPRNDLKNPQSNNVIESLLNRYQYSVSHRHGSFSQISEKPKFSEFYELIGSYNSEVEDWNDLAEKSEDNCILLPRSVQPDLFKFTPPEKKILKKLMDGYAYSNLVLLLDVSQSMSEAEKLPLLKKTVEQLLPLMRNKDKISIVVYSGSAIEILPPTSCSDTTTILTVIRKLTSGGGTFFSQGLRKAYKTAQNGYIKGGNNRLLVATDGEFVIDEKLRFEIEQNSSKGLILSIFQFGKNAIKTENLEKIAGAGKGNYEIINQDNAYMFLLNEVRAIQSQMH